MTVPSSTARATQMPRPPTSRTLVTPASSAVAASFAHRIAMSAGGIVMMLARSARTVPRKCPWQSHIPGMTAGTRSAVASGSRGPAGGARVVDGRTVEDEAGVGDRVAPAGHEHVGMDAEHRHLLVVRADATCAARRRPGPLAPSGPRRAPQAQPSQAKHGDRAGAQQERAGDRHAGDRDHRMTRSQVGWYRARRAARALGCRDPPRGLPSCLGAAGLGGVVRGHASREARPGISP